MTLALAGAAQGEHALAAGGADSDLAQAVGGEAGAEAMGGGGEAAQPEGVLLGLPDAGRGQGALVGVGGLCRVGGFGGGAKAVLEAGDGEEEQVQGVVELEEQ